MNDKKIQLVYDLIDTIFSVIRLFSSTKFRKVKQIRQGYDKCIIMGNGPSLIDSLKKNEAVLSEVDLVAVNFMGLSPEYLQYKPNIYIFCDPAFWFENISPELEEKVIRLYEIIALETHWSLQLYIPYQAKKEKRIDQILSQNKNITLAYYNKTKFEGYKKLKYFVYNKQWGMPRTQNVLIAALMLTIYSKYKEIYLFGAENNWIKDLWVGDDNITRASSTHFDGDKDDGAVNKLHVAILSLYYTYLSYNEIAVFPSETKIYNCTPSSFIDAFKRKKQLF